MDCKVTTVTFSNGTIHKEARCFQCGRFYKYLPQGGADTFFFGKYKGRLMADVAKEDPDYMKFLFNSDTTAINVKKKIEKALYGTTTQETK